MSRGRDRFVVAALAIALALLPASAHAQSADKIEAHRHFDLGVADAKAGAYREAVVEFQRAYELSPNFAVLYNVAMAQAALGDPAGALASYERYLAEGETKVPSDRRARVAAEMKRLVPRTGVILLRVSPDAARVALDGAPIDPAALAPAGLARGVRVNVGAHKLAATAPGFLPVERAITVGSGDAANVTLALAPVPPPLAAGPPPVAAPPDGPPPSSVEEPPVPVVLPPLAQPRPSPRPLVAERPAPPSSAERSTGALQRELGYIVGAAGIVALATGGVFYLVARSDVGKAVAARCSQNLDTCTGDGRKDWADAQEEVKRSRIAAAVGGLLVVGGAGLVLMAPSASGAPAGVALAGRW